MSKITYNAQGQLIIDKNLPKYGNVPSSNLFPLGNTYDNNYFVINDNDDGISRDTWNSTYVNESDHMEDDENIWSQFKTKNIKLIEMQNPWFLSCSTELLKIMEENNELLNKKFKLNDNLGTLYNSSNNSQIDTNIQNIDVTTEYFNGISVSQIIITIIIFLLVIAFIIYKKYRYRLF